MTSRRASRNPAAPANTATYPTGTMDQIRSTQEYSRVSSDTSQAPAQTPAYTHRQTINADTAQRSTPAPTPVKTGRPAPCGRIVLDAAGYDHPGQWEFRA